METLRVPVKKGGDMVEKAVKSDGPSLDPDAAKFFRLNANWSIKSRSR